MIERRAGSAGGLHPPKPSTDGSSPDGSREDVALGSDIVGIWAQRIAASGLVVPALVVLEMLRPFSFVASQFLVALDPLLAPIVGRSGRQASALLERRSNLDSLVRTIEGHSKRVASVQGDEV